VGKKKKEGEAVNKKEKSLLRAKKTRLQEDLEKIPFFSR
jgi:hypothetical protein